MDSIFRTVLNMSLTGSYVILAILLVRLLLKNAPKKYAYALWTVAGFRLCCPVSFEAVFSLFRLPYVSRNIPQPLTQQPASQLIPGEMPQAAITAPAAPNVPVYTAPETEFGLLQVLTVIWLAGMAIMVAYSAMSYFRLRYCLRFAVKEQGNVYRCAELATPFILGFFHPRIYLPAGLEGEAKEYVLAHEGCHLKRWDHFVKLLSFGILTVHWFNPLCHVAFWLMSRDMEMSCDERVLAAGVADKHNYSATLVSIAVRRKLPLPSPLAFGESGVKSRVKNALRWRNPSRWMTVAAVILCLCIGAACVADPPEADVPEGKYILLYSLADNSGSYLVVRGNTVQAGPYASPEEFSIPNKGWQSPPFTQQEWEQLANPSGFGTRSPNLEKISECEYMDLGTVVGDREVETAAGIVVYPNETTHTFLLRKDGQLYFCEKQTEKERTGVMVQYMIPAWSDLDPVGKGINELDNMVDQLIYAEGVQTTEISENKILAAIAKNEALYKETYSHPYVLQYISYMFAEKGVSGEKEIFMGLLFEKVLDRKNETVLVPPTAIQATKTFMTYMEKARELYGQKGYTYMLAEYPVATAMLLYLTNY